VGIGPDFPEASTGSQVAARALEGFSRLCFVVVSCFASIASRLQWTGVSACWECSFQSEAAAFRPPTRAKRWHKADLTAYIDFCTLDET
jgi:hypothetical protein